MQQKYKAGTQVLIEVKEEEKETQTPAVKHHAPPSLGLCSCVYRITNQSALRTNQTSEKAG